MSLPTAAFALLALVPFALLQIRFIGKLRTVPAALGSAPGSVASWRRYVIRRSVGAAFGGAFWLACAFAASGALTLPRYVSEPVTGAEIAFVIDASNSMLSAEGRRSRLDAAKEFAGRLAASAEGAGLSVVAFRGRPTTLCPSTRDRKAFADALAWAGPTATSAAGSDVGAAIDEAARPVFSAGTARVIVVLSDGNDTGGAASAASARAASAGAALAFVGFGGQESSPVFDMDGAPIVGKDGSAVRTALDHAAMRGWAAAGRGTFVRADDPDAFARIAALCAGVASSTGRRRDVRVEVDASPALALAALSSLGLALALSAVPRAAKRSPAVPRRAVEDKRDA